MLTLAKIQLDREDYEFIKQVHKQLKYRSFSEYVREAVRTKVAMDQKQLRQNRRMEAMEMIGKTSYEDLFESLEGDDFADR